MTDIAVSFGRALESARHIFAVDSPIINIIVGILIAYLAIYFITFYLGPVLFGLRPYHPWPMFARTLHHVTRRAADFNMNGGPAIELISKVASAIDNHENETY